MLPEAPAQLRRPIAAKQLLSHPLRSLLNWFCSAFVPKYAFCLFVKCLCPCLDPLEDELREELVDGFRLAIPFFYRHA